MSNAIEQNGLTYAGSKEEILDIVCGLIDEAQRDYIFDRRKHDRHSLALAINATPIEDGRTGAEFEALTHDISAGGLSFVSNARIDEPYLLLRFPSFNRPPLILEIVRQNQIGPFWIIAGKFQTAL
jgi:hypothetical protein